MADASSGTPGGGGRGSTRSSSAAALDPNRLPRGRTYARQDRVAQPRRSSPARSPRSVQGSRPPAATGCTSRSARYGDDEWDAGASPPSPAGPATPPPCSTASSTPGSWPTPRAAGVELLPGPGELRPRCSCPDWADPCKHAAAVCYLVADVLDDDPFAAVHAPGPDPRRPARRLSRAQRRPGPDGRAADDDGLDPDAEALARRSGRGPGRGRRSRGTGTRGGRAAAAAGAARSPRSPGPPAAWPADPPRRGAVRHAAACWCWPPTPPSGPGPSCAATATAAWPSAATPTRPGGRRASSTTGRRSDRPGPGRRAAAPTSPTGPGLAPRGRGRPGHARRGGPGARRWPPWPRLGAGRSRTAACAPSWSRRQQPHHRAPASSSGSPTPAPGGAREAPGAVGDRRAAGRVPRRPAVTGRTSPRP